MYKFKQYYLVKQLNFLKEGELLIKNGLIGPKNFQYKGQQVNALYGQCARKMSKSAVNYSIWEKSFELILSSIVILSIIVISPTTVILSTLVCPGLSVETHLHF